MSILERIFKPKYIFADEYFKMVKQNMNSLTEEDLKKVLSKLDDLILNSQKTGQRNLYNKLIKRKGILEKELKVLASGFCKYISTDVLYTMNDKVKERPVRLDRLENYNRFLPNEVINIIEEIKNKRLFDCYYVLYTDLSKNSKKQADKVYEKSKDPILFGCCTEDINKEENERLFKIADWEDKYCNLTFDKLLKELGNEKENIDYNDADDIDIDYFISK